MHNCLKVQQSTHILVSSRQRKHTFCHGFIIEDLFLAHHIYYDKRSLTKVFPHRLYAHSVNTPLFCVLSLQMTTRLVLLLIRSFFWLSPSLLFLQ